ncbi:MAG: hypothetical protein JST11_08340 [Acidobacteria bacterium]|nr:hypothetical protein [Acidobacteriota bacterium]
MIEILLGAVTALMLALILARRLSPEFKRRGELPKYQFLETLTDPVEKRKTRDDIS